MHRTTSVSRALLVAALAGIVACGTPAALPPAVPAAVQADGQASGCAPVEECPVPPGGTADAAAPAEVATPTATPEPTTPPAATPAPPTVVVNGGTVLVQGGTVIVPGGSVTVVGTPPPATGPGVPVTVIPPRPGSPVTVTPPPAPPTVPRTVPPRPPADPGDMPPITVQGDQIMRDGEPWWFLGYNSFVWSGDCGHDDEKMSAADVDAWFADMRHDGHGAVRLFFYDGWDIDRLDAAVESAKAHDVYLTITLDDAIGGCGENDKDASWFADPSERDTFQQHMSMLLERYRGETAIAWFEFFNEPDYEGGALRQFYDEMGAVADGIDPDRLFSSGTVAPYWLDGEDNFRDVHESPGIDIASLHEYDMGEVESNHGPGVRANSAGKPVIVGEFGIDAGPGCDSFESRADRFADKAAVYTSTDAGYAGAFGWAWQPGGGGCELGNLDADTATQDVLRSFVR